MAYTVQCSSCGKRMAVPYDLYEKRVRGRVSLLACRGCNGKIKLDGSAGTHNPVVSGGLWLGEEEELVVPDSAPASSAPLSMRLPIARIGRYALFDQFATGGMATVHLGRLDGAGGFSRVVAIKRLLPNLVQNEDFTQMLLNEARLAARVRHPNVVPTLDVVASKGDVLLVLEYVHGEALSTLCRKQAKEKKEHIPLDVAVRIVQDMLQGLEAVHDALDEKGKPLGLVHRDISPPNVIVGADGQSRVLDFGIAKALESLEESNPNRVKGKSGYMSPEQIRGERLTQRSDVFSAGIILWELLSTRRLFMADSEHERMQKILDGNYPKPSEYRQDLSSKVEAVAMRALQSEAEARFESPRDFALALEQAVPGASARRVAEWVNDLAAETLAARARLVAQVETWAGPGDLPLSSAPFTAEAAVLFTPPPPTPEAPHPALDLLRRSPERLSVADGAVSVSPGGVRRTLIGLAVAAVALAIAIAFLVAAK